MMQMATRIAMAITFLLTCVCGAYAAEESADSGSVTGEITIPAPNPAADQSVQRQVGPDEFVVVCPVEGMIDEGTFILVERALERAKAGARALVLEVDTFGGRLDACFEVTDAILDAPCPTIAYIKGKGAISAGAIISFSCDDIIMTDSAPIGAASPVAITSEGAMPLGEKEVSFVRAKMAALAEANGHNAALGQAMIDKDIELIGRPRDDGTYDVADAQADGVSATPDREPTEAEKAVDDLADSLPSTIREPVRDLVKGVMAGDPEAPKGTTPEERADGTITVLRSGKLLTLTPKEAVRYRLIDTTADNLNDVLYHFGHYGAQRFEIVPTWSEALFKWLISPPVAGILLLIGIGGLYLELKTPGFGLPGIVGIIGLALFFGARSVAGLSGWIEVLLIIVGLGLLAIEIFVLPGFGIAGISGILCILVGLYLSLTYSDFQIPQYSWDFERLREAGQTVAITTVMLPILVFVTWKLFPKTPVYGMIVHQQAESADDGYTVQSGDALQNLVGLTGTALSNLRPAGRGRFRDKTYQVVSRAEFIEPGTAIRIVQVDGNRYVVDPVERGENENEDDV